MLSFFPRGVLDEILNLIESVSEDFPSYSFRNVKTLAQGMQMITSLFLRPEVLSCHTHTQIHKLIVYYHFPFSTAMKNGTFSHKTSRDKTLQKSDEPFSSKDFKMKK